MLPGMTLPEPSTVELPMMVARPMSGLVIEEAVGSSRARLSPIDRPTSSVLSSITSPQSPHITWPPSLSVTKLLRFPQRGHCCPELRMESNCTGLDAVRMRTHNQSDDFTQTVRFTTDS